METTPRIEGRVLLQLHAAMRAGTLSLVDEHGHPMELLLALNRRCWARLTDAQDGKVYVHELPNANELQEPRYLELLGINV